jgi:hypothetical protein
MIDDMEDTRMVERVYRTLPPCIRIDVGFILNPASSIRVAAECKDYSS